MKLRIRGNSLRLRVSQSELARLAETGSTEDVIRFSPTAVLRYRLQVEPDAELSAVYSGSELSVVLPPAEVQRWLADEEVSIRGEQRIDDGQVLRILVEKDFTCLAPREDEDDADLFPNPDAGGPTAG